MADRVSQLPVEAVVAPTSTKARVSQEVAEAVVAPTSTKARVSQEPVEAVVRPTSVKALISQLVVEVVIRPSAVSDLALDYAIRALAHSDLALDYAINALDRTQVGADLAIDYALNASQAGVNLTLSYKVAKASKIQQRGADLRVRYEILATLQAGANLGLDYAIQPATAAVGTSLTVDAPIQIVVHPGADLPMTWEVQVPEPVASDLTIDYEVRVGSTEVVYIFTPQVSAAPAPSAQAVGSDFTFDAPIRQSLGTDVTFDTPIHAATGSQLGISYPIRVSTGAEQSLGWAVHRSVGASMAMRWRRHAAKTPAAKRARASLRLSWRIDPPTIPTLPASKPPEPKPSPVAEPRLRESVAPPPTLHDEPVVEVVAVVEASRLGRYSREETLALARRLRIGFALPGAGGIVATPTTVTASAPRPHEDNGDREAQRRLRGRARRSNG